MTSRRMPAMSMRRWRYIFLCQKRRSVRPKTRGIYQKRPSIYLVSIKRDIVYFCRWLQGGCRWWVCGGGGRSLKRPSLWHSGVQRQKRRRMGPERPDISQKRPSMFLQMTSRDENAEMDVEAHWCVTWNNRTMLSFLCLSIYLPTYLSPIYPSIYLSMCPSI